MNSNFNERSKGGWHDWILSCLPEGLLLKRDDSRDAALSEIVRKNFEAQGCTLDSKKKIGSTQVMVFSKPIPPSGPSS